MHPLYAKSDELSRAAIGAAIEVHRHKGPGLMESIYERCLLRELELRQMVGVFERLRTKKTKGTKYLCQGKGSHLTIQHLDRHFAAFMGARKGHIQVLMPNHYHLLLETPETNLSRGGQWLKLPPYSIQSPHQRSRHLFGPLCGDHQRATDRVAQTQAR
jgi:hypothetical protein